jgi:oxygen-independent coproporphyrinogen-3 oxidase
MNDLSSTFGEHAMQEARAAITQFVRDGLMEQRGDLVCLTVRGRLLSNEVFERFILADEIAF